jgi:A/G-specific adenine glycosylase
MQDKNDIVFLRKELLSWFDKHRRDFPWRKEEVSNYEVIFSEVLLQRTKAETVSRFYDSFFTRYPNWSVLAEATIEELESFLKPLGLSKHRARRIFRIANEYKKKQGVLPKNRYQLQESEMASLYLGNAYELFILNHRSALIDVNMARLLTRYFAPEGVGDLRINKAFIDAHPPFIGYSHFLID